MLNKMAVNSAVTPRFIRVTNGGPMGATKSITCPSKMMINRGIRLLSTWFLAALIRYALYEMASKQRRIIEKN
jgi:hypothetical protein